MENSAQSTPLPRKFRLGRLGSLNQVVNALGKTIRAMASGEIDTQDGARICNGLGIMRSCLETIKLEDIERRLDALRGMNNDSTRPTPAHPIARRGTAASA
jgi:hypothetical protein